MFGSKPPPPVVEWGSASNPLAARAGAAPAAAAIPSTNGRISPKNSRSTKNEVIVENPLDTPERKGKQLHQLIRNYAYVFRPESYNPKKTPYEVQADIVSKALALIRENVDLNTRDDHDMTTLLNACTRGSADIALAILEKGGIDINAKGVDEFANGHTPLTQACNHRLETVALILIEMGASLDKTNKSGETALMLACKKGLLSVVTKLIDKGATIGLVDGNGHNALDLTCGILRRITGKRLNGSTATVLSDAGFKLTHDKETYIPIARLLLGRGLRSEQCRIFEELMPRPPSGPRPSAGASNASAGKPAPRPPSYPRGAGSSLVPLRGGKRRSKRTRYRKGKRPFSSRKNRR